MVKKQPPQAEPPLPESYEDAVAELEALVQRMEAGSLSLEQSLAAYKRGVALSSHCRTLLADVQQQVRILEGELLEPFDLQTTDASAPAAAGGAGSGA